MFKVLFLMQLPPPVHGASMVNKMIQDSRLINETFDCEFLNISPANSVKDIGSASFSKLVSTAKIFGNALKLFMKHKPQLVYLTLSPHGLAFYKDAALAMLLKFLGAKLAFHMHGKGIQKEVVASSLKRKLYKFVFRNVEVIHLAERLRSDLRELKEPKSIHIVNNGVYKPGQIQPKDRRIQGRISILYLSNFMREKGALELLNASAILAKQFDDFEVTFVGKFFDETYEKEFKTALTEFNLPNIKLIEGVYGDKKEQLFAKSDVFVLPTYYRNECFPLSILEAMSHGLAVVSTDEGAITDIVVDNVNGFIVGKMSPNEIASGLKKYLEEPSLLNNHKQSSLGKFESEFSSDVFERNLTNTLLKIIG